MNFILNILGSGAATPTHTRNCSGQIINMDGLKILLDCGENTQGQIRHFHQKMQGINYIFLSHLHGDHCFGLPGLLASMHLCGRTEPLEIFAPKGLKAAMELLMEVTATHLQYELKFNEIELTEKTLLLNHPKCKVWGFPLMHSVPTYGYIFEESDPLPSMKPGVKDQYQLTPLQIQQAKNGADIFLENGTRIPNNLLVNPPRKARKYAYCCDTAYDESIVPYLKEVDLLCLESTFDDKMKDLAAEKKHLTAKQAGKLASECGAKQLILTHFSARYKDIAPLLQEARNEFPNTFEAFDGSRWTM